MHQLVLQFAAKSLRDYDDLVTLEQQLAAALGVDGVDGHDMGSGEANIFIVTCDAHQTFRQLVPVLERSGRLSAVIAAYRDTDQEDYRVLWPEDSQRQFRVA
jgi:hypothetical protein